MAVSYIDINELLADWAAVTPPILDITVEHILSALRLNIDSYNEVFQYLMRMQDIMVIPMKVVLCPQNHKGEPFGLEEEIDTENIFDCWCGEEDFAPDNLIIVFNFTDDFRSDSIKKKKVAPKKKFTSDIENEDFNYVKTVKQLINEGLIEVSQKGVIIVDKSIRVYGNSEGNLNTGNNVTQINSISNETTSEFHELLLEIKKIDDEAKRVELEYFVEELKEVYQKGDKKKGKQLLGFLRNALGDVGSIASIASMLGVAL